MKNLLVGNAESASPSEAELFSLWQKYGGNSNSFLTLYDGYETFVSSRGVDFGVIRYIRGKYAWIAATEPLAPKENAGALLSEFAERAQSQGRVAMMLPVNSKFLPVAEAAGFSAVAIGSEPTFLFDQYEPSIEIVHAAKRLAAKGARVQELTPQSVSRRPELNKLVAEWLSSRKMAELGFLNRVRPWQLGEHKKYFAVEFAGKVLAFVAAVPAVSTQGWYLVDTFRAPTAPPGSTELLTLETMRLLKSGGAKWVSLGVAPLSNLEHGEKGPHFQLEAALRFLYTRGDAFYSFDSLFRYKLKFKPNTIEPAYLLIHPKRVTVVNAMGILEAFVGGPRRALVANLKHHLSHFTISGRLLRDQRKDVAWAKPARTISDLAKRCSLTLVCSVVGGFYLGAEFPYLPAFLLFSFLFLSAAVMEVAMGTRRLLCVWLWTLGLTFLTQPYFYLLQKIPYPVAWPWRWMFLSAVACLGGVIGSLHNGARLVALLCAVTVAGTFYSEIPSGWYCLVGLLAGYLSQRHFFFRPGYLPRFSEGG